MAGRSKVQGGRRGEVGIFHRSKVHSMLSLPKWLATPAALLLPPCSSPRLPSTHRCGFLVASESPRDSVDLSPISPHLFWGSDGAFPELPNTAANDDFGCVPST
eukprot:1704745-Prymnesium_polylepis.1